MKHLQINHSDSVGEHVCSEGVYRVIQSIPFFGCY